MTTVTLATIRSAARRIEPYVHRTPVMTSRLVDAEAGCELHFKCENLQKVGAFKARGAHNAVLCLDAAQRARGVATHSSGNHAAALALAASRFGLPCYIVMPDNAPASKVAAVRAYGGEITFCAAEGHNTDCLAAYVRDPEGIIIDLIEDLPAGKPAG